MKEFFHQYFFLLDQEAKKKIPFLIMTFLIAPLMDVFGIGLIGLFLALISDTEHFIKIYPFNQPIFAHLKHAHLIIITGMFVMCAFLTKSVACYYIQKNMSVFSFKLALRLKLRLMKAYQSASYSFHLMKNSSYLLNRMIQADGFVGGVLLPSLTFFSNFLVGLAILCFLFIMHPFTTIGLSILFTLIFWLNTKFFWKKSLELGQVAASSGGEIFKTIKQALYGLKEIRVLGTEQYFFDKLELVAKNFAYTQGIYNAYQLIPRYLIESALITFTIALCLIEFAV